VDPGITLRSCCFEWDTQIEYTLASHDEHCVSTRLELLVGRKTKIEEVAGTWSLCMTRGKKVGVVHSSTTIPLQHQDYSELLDGSHKRCDIHTRDVSNMEAISMDVVNASMSNDEAKQRMSWLQERWTNTTRPAIRPATARIWHSICMYSSAASSYARNILVRIRTTMVTYRVSGYAEKDSASNSSAWSAELSQSRNDRDEVRPAQCDIATTCKDTMEAFQKDK